MRTACTEEVRHRCDSMLKAGRLPSGTASVDSMLVTLTRMESVKFFRVKGVYDTVSMVGACTHAA